VELTDKIDLLQSDENRTDIIWALRREDIQAEAIERFGRLLNDDEINEVSKKLEWGLSAALEGGILEACFTRI